MSGFTCHQAQSLIDEWLNGELGNSDVARMTAHLDGCPGCRSDCDRGRAALSLLSAVGGDELPAGASEATLDGVRRRVMATIRTAEHNPAPRSIWQWLPAAFATAAVVVVAAVAPSRTATPVATEPGSVTTAVLTTVVPSATELASTVGDDVEVVSSSGREGTTLRWQGSGDSFVVLRSSRPASFEGAQVAVVCGSTWTDPEPATGLKFYRVVRSRQHC